MIVTPQHFSPYVVRTFTNLAITLNTCGAVRTALNSSTSNIIVEINEKARNCNAASREMKAALRSSPFVRQEERAGIRKDGPENEEHDHTQYHNESDLRRDVRSLDSENSECGRKRDDTTDMLLLASLYHSAQKRDTYDHMSSA